MSKASGPRGETGNAGRKNVTVHERTPNWRRPPKPRPGAPNVVCVVLDDLGFAQLGCYGASVATPTIDRLARQGLRYSNFHVTAMCSPTRACLLTGRNHHAAGVGYLANFDTGFDNARGAIGPDCATLGEMLEDAGYGTYAVGKWHLTPPSHMRLVGPFDHWPTRRGFHRWYGFLTGEEDQYAPEMYYDQHHEPLPARENYHMSEDLVDRAQEFLSDHISSTPDRPFFLYLAFGATHAPHQVPEPYRSKYRGAFDHGWDEERTRIIERQKALGIVPETTELAPRNPDVRAWNSLSPAAHRLLTRMQEVYAGFTEHTDAQIGRLVAFLEQYGQLDNTLLIVMSDNGASGEGGAYGTINEYRYFLGLADSLEDGLAQIDDIGGPLAHNHYPSGWAQAGNTPLKFYKKYTLGGGVRAPLIVHWPAGIGEAGVIRGPFHHAIDIAPTILDVCRVTPLKQRNGLAQMPLHGQSMAYSFASDSRARQRTTQYFEMGGQRGIYDQGWKAVTYHQSGEAFADDVWQLYHLSVDFNEMNDLAESQPDKLNEMVELWWKEAEANCVLPLDDRAQGRALAIDTEAQERDRFRVLPGSRLMSIVTGPAFAMRSFKITADVRARAEGDNGVLFAYGHKAAGFVLFLHEDRLVFDYNIAGRHAIHTTSALAPTGASILAAKVNVEGDGARLQLLFNDQVMLDEPLPQQFPAGFTAFSVQCGYNSPSPVSRLYAAPNRFAGVLHCVDIELGPSDPQARGATWDAAIRSQ